MTRKTIDFTATEGRDTGKLFRITELPAAEGERWAMRALNAIAKATGDVPLSFLSSGAQGLAALGISAFAKARWEEIEPLIHEMFRCVTIIDNPADPDKARALIESDIEEVITRLQLRQEVLDLHLGFFKAAVHWISTAARSSLQQQSAPKRTRNTKTSHP